MGAQAVWQIDCGSDAFCRGATTELDHEDSAARVEGELIDAPRCVFLLRGRREIGHHDMPPSRWRCNEWRRSPAALGAWRCWPPLRSPRENASRLNVSGRNVWGPPTPNSSEGRSAFSSDPCEATQSRPSTRCSSCVFRERAGAAASRGRPTLWRPRKPRYARTCRENVLSAPTPP